MTAPPSPPLRTAGARFSLVDGIALTAGAAATWAIPPLPDELAWVRWVPAVALGHFFLFCNVFRVRRNYELAWTAVFLANASAWFWSGAFSWPAVLALQAPVTALAIGLEMRSPRYHGIGSRRLNPHLDAYLQGQDG